MSEQSSKDQRRFPRIFLQKADVFQAMAGARVAWANGVATNVLDLSYTGAALERPKAESFEKGQSIELKFSFAGGQPASVKSKVVRADPNLVGVQFESLSPQARLAFETFLTDNLLGLHLHAVDPNLFSKTQDFTHWFHGPKDTNVFIWIKSEQLHKAIVEIDHQILVWNQGVLSQGKSRADLLSAIEDYYSPVLFESVRAGRDIDRQLHARVVKLLSQIKGSPHVVNRLLKQLQEGPAA
jgi:hypothetical protein